ncbi:Oxysterol-binding protein 4 [Coemansia asiatica]|uniref:Oxysterol-binding protein 4 n=1 Tax=Coemansia asiatica TaxID=1052880 RepID=A0A9W7XLW1_9FUNG|nr:Oxysterol-binding protein 4 [Coemansia asiatica]
MTSDSKSVHSTSSASTSSKSAASAGDSAANAPASSQSSLGSFLKAILSFTGDLSSLTCPSYLLNGISLLEYGAHWSDYPHVLAEITKATDSEERIKLVTRWFVSTLYGSYNKRVAESNLGEKKPFNPILGEQFFASWDDPEYGETKFVCEQVSHHPPVSAIYFENENAGIYASGHFSQKSKFKNVTMKVVQEGRVTLRMKNSDEIYCLTLPDLDICSILSGKPFLEMNGTTYIRSSKGYTSELQWYPKPYFYGEYHKFDGRIFKDSAAEFTPNDNGNGNGKEQLYTINGKWVAESRYVNLNNGQEGILFDVGAQPSSDIIIKPLESQSELESRFVWHKVSEALASGNYDVASREKTAIEEEQRTLRKQRAEDNIKWEPSMFYWVEDADAEPAVKEAYAYLYAAKESVGKGSWVYKSSLHVAGKRSMSASANASTNASGTQTPSDAFSTAPSSVA